MKLGTHVTREEEMTQPIFRVKVTMGRCGNYLVKACEHDRETKNLSVLKPNLAQA